MWPFRAIMDRRHREVIEANIIYLSRNTKRLLELLRHLEVEEVLNLYELAVIKKCRSNSEKCYRLYETIVRKDEDAFKTLMRSLMKTGNEDLVHFLWLDDFSALLESESKSSSNLHNTNQMSRSGDPSKRHRPVVSGEQSVVSILITVILLTASASLPIFLVSYLVTSIFD